MPDPDIPPIVLTQEEIDKIQSTVPHLPDFYRKKWQVLNLDKSVINSLLDNQKYAIEISEIQDNAGDSIAKRVAHWFASAVSGNEEYNIDLPEKQDLIDLAQMSEKNEISSTSAKELFHDLLKGATDPRKLAEERNLLQVSDEAAIAEIVDEVMNDPSSASSIADIKAGKEKAIGYLVGQVMKRSRGKANPALAQKLIRNCL